MLTDLQYLILKRLAPLNMEATAYANKSKVLALLGSDFYSSIQGKTVVDFGCGTGEDAVEMAQHGAQRVIGVDLREQVLAVGRKNAEAAGVSDRCGFATVSPEKADIIVSLDAFEHFEDPAAILRIMDGLLKPEGEIHVSFGPPWYHPLGGHLFSVFPWAHLVFSEKALIRWRSDFKTDGATRFSEVAGGLNQMTIRRFERIIEESPFRFSKFEPVPIRKLQPLYNALTREFFTAIVRCRLVKRTRNC